MTKRTRWIIELDYNADPETTADAVRTDLQDHLSHPFGKPIVDGDRLICDDLADAVAIRLRYDLNLVSVVAEPV